MTEKPKLGLVLLSVFPPALAPAAPPPAAAPAAEDATAPGSRPDVGRVQDVLLQGEQIKRERGREETNAWSCVDSPSQQAVCPLSTSRPLLLLPSLTRPLFFSLSLSTQNSLSLFADRPLLDQVDAPVGKLNSHRRRRVGTKSFFFFDFHLFFSHLSLPPLNKKNKIKKDSCVFSHPHENARRRDPRTHAYVPEPCPDYRHAGLCLLGSACPFSHGGEFASFLACSCFFLNRRPLTTQPNKKKHSSLRAPPPPLPLPHPPLRRGSLLHAPRLLLRARPG